MSEVQVIEPTEVLVPLGRDAAVKLDGRIRRLAKQAGDQLVQVGRLLDEARSGRVHEALGHASWTAYVADALGGSLQLSGEARLAMVSMMAGEGMSVRAIAAATGVGKSTVDRDLAQVSQRGTVDGDESAEPTVPQRDSSDSVIGLNGKTYAKPVRKPRVPRKKPDPKPSAPPKPPADTGESKKPVRQVQVPTAYRDELKKLRPIVAELEALARDPRFGKARARFNAADRDVIERHIESLRMFRAAMDESVVEGKSA